MLSVGGGVKENINFMGGGEGAFNLNYVGGVVYKQVCSSPPLSFYWDRLVKLLLYHDGTTQRD